MSLRRDLSELSKELQLAGLAGVALALSLILPWYQESVARQNRFVQTNLSAFGVFTFVEAAVLLVALAVVFLVWARSQRRGFHLPGGDGVAITIAGGWAALLLVWRLFDRPDAPGQGTTVGIQWGIFGAFVAAGALIAAGARVRAAHVPEPPNPAADEVNWVAPPPRERRPDRRPRDSGAVTEVLRDRPAWEGEPREPSDPSRARTTRLHDDAPPTTRLPDDPDPSRARTTKLPEPPSDRAETQRLWEDDDPPR